MIAIDGNYLAIYFQPLYHIGSFCQYDISPYRYIAVDKIDRLIIRELQLNARLSNQELAERINLSPSPCLRRVRRLEESGILSGYTAKVDQEAYGLPLNVFVSVRLEKQNEQSIKEFEDGLQFLDQVMECYLMTGSRDYLLRVVSVDLKSYEKFIRNDLTKLPGIAAIESSFAFSNVKNQQVLPNISQLD